MCGIAGILHKKGHLLKENIVSLTDSMQHRGPDDNDFICAENYTLGHRRLIILDLETGNQPMCNEDNSIHITYNGELYNYIDLRDQLREAGHIFKTQSDTEVVIHAYEQWGKGCIKRFRGMFAFGIVDERNKVLFLARDHFGIKPLVYYSDNNLFAFASEIQALKQLGNIKPEIDEKSIDTYLLLNYIPAPDSIFKQVKKLPPAHYMTVDFDGFSSGHIPYWSFEFKAENSKTEEAWLMELESIISDSVKVHLMSDVPFGAFLSGGTDSTLVVSLMSQIMNDPVKTFTIGFNEPEYCEVNYALQVADKWETDHHQEIISPSATEILPLLVKHYGEPFGDSSAIPTYYVSNLAAKHVKMVLSGDGGDETFAGYQSYINWITYLQTKYPVKTIRQILYHAMHLLIPKHFPYDRKPLPTMDNWLKFMQYFSEDIRMRLWRDEYGDIVKQPLSSLEVPFNNNCSDRLQQVQYFDLLTYLPNDILTKVDIASMMNSIEVRTPLVDKEVIEFACNIPHHLNFRKTENNNYQGKLLIKKILEKYFPEDFIYRKKSGFSIPVNYWFGEDSKLFKYSMEVLTDRGANILGYFKKDAVIEVINSDFKDLIWLLLFLEEWLAQNK